MVTLGSNKRKRFSLRNLTRASVDSTYFHFSLEPLCNVQSLWISMAKMDSNNHVLPTFYNLPYLDLNSINYRWHFLVEILKQCPKLQIVGFDEVCSGSYLSHLFLEHLFFWLLTFIKFRIYYFAMLRITTQTRIGIRLGRVNLHDRVF